MKIAIMIPMSYNAAHNKCRPNDMAPVAWNIIRWPELSEGLPMLQKDIANTTQALIEEDLSFAQDHVVIVTRSDVVFYRVRRMVAEGADLDVAVYLVRDDGQTRYPMDRRGNVGVNLFGHVAGELADIMRAQLAARKAGQ